MIRIETTAEFDAEGRFIARGQVLRPVTPGSHRVTIELVESEPTSTGETTIIEDTDDPMLKRINGVLVWTGQILEESRRDDPVDLLIEKDGLLLLNAEPETSANLDIRALIEADREERMQHILGDWQS